MPLWLVFIFNVDYGIEISRLEVAVASTHTQSSYYTSTTLLECSPTVIDHEVPLLEI